MAHADDIIDVLWSLLPDGATNSQIARRLGIQSHQAVFMVTRDLAQRGMIRRERTGREWVFSAVEEQSKTGGAIARSRVVRDLPRSGAPLSPAAFAALARKVLSERNATTLAPGTLPEVCKRFDLVAQDGRIVGDAKYFTLVRSTGLPTAKFSIIAEHVWLMEKTRAPVRFLVFGNDRNVPLLWLARYGNLVGSTVSYFLTDDGQLEHLGSS